MYLALNTFPPVLARPTMDRYNIHKYKLSKKSHLICTELNNLK